jgi:uncharacterized membrane protein
MSMNVVADGNTLYALSLHCLLLYLFFVIMYAKRFKKFYKNLCCLSIRYAAWTLAGLFFYPALDNSPNLFAGRVGGGQKEQKNDEPNQMFA